MDASHLITVLTTLFMSFSSSSSSSYSSSSTSYDLWRLFLPALLALVVSACRFDDGRRWSFDALAARLGLKPRVVSLVLAAKVGSNYRKTMSDTFHAVLQHTMALMERRRGCGFDVTEILVGITPVMYPAISRPIAVAPGVFLTTSSEDHTTVEHVEGQKTAVEVKELRLELRGDGEAGLGPIVEFTRACLQDYEARQMDELIKAQKIFTLDSHSTPDAVEWNEQSFVTSKSFDNMFFEGKTRVLDRVRRFSCPRARAEDARLGLPHTLGFMLFGEPGTGKTSFIKSLARSTGRHVFSIPARGIRNRDMLFSVFRRERVCTNVASYKIPYSRRLYVFEDIDCCEWRSVVKTRGLAGSEGRGEGRGSGENDTMRLAMAMARLVAKGDKDAAAAAIETDLDDRVRLADLLEVLDGIVEMPGRLIVITSNDPSVIDPALLRPGRVDEVLHFGRMSASDAKQMARLWLGDDLDAAVEASPELAEALASDGVVTQATLGAILQALFRDGAPAGPIPEQSLTKRGAPPLDPAIGANPAGPIPEQTLTSDPAIGHRDGGVEGRSPSFGQALLRDGPGRGPIPE